jgi:pantoate--beta-alanine ligase
MPVTMLKMVTDPAALAEELDQMRDGGRSVGLVPTMGALHAGHASLIERAALDCDAVVVSVFVNPLQFGPGEDLDAYPRRLATDAVAAAGAGATLVFAPSREDMYPEGFCTTVHVGGLSETMEGAARPGHFDGVTTVVAKLFALSGRCRAYFGEKDFQQLQVIRRLARDLGLPVEVIACPTVREPDGLALSSRNAYLTPRHREAAPVLNRALRAGAAAVRSGVTDPVTIRSVMAGEVAAEPLASLDYAEVVDPDTLRAPPEVGGPVRLLIAARLGGIRLIDNLGV